MLSNTRNVRKSTQKRLKSLAHIEVTSRKGPQQQKATEEEKKYIRKFTWFWQRIKINLSDKVEANQECQTFNKQTNRMTVISFIPRCFASE